MVAARVRLASTPRVPLASSAPAGRRPGSLTVTPEDLDPRAGGDERHQHREDHERDLDDHPLEEVARRHPADRDHDDQHEQVARRRPAYQSRGVATTTSMKPSSASSLRCAGARWTGEWPWKCSLWPCPAPTSGARVLGVLARRRRRRYGGRPGQAAREREDHDAARRRRRGRRTAGRCRRPWCRSRPAGCPSAACSSAVSAKPLSSATWSRPSGLRGGVEADHAGEEQRDEQAGDDAGPRVDDRAHAATPRPVADLERALGPAPAGRRTRGRGGPRRRCRPRGR